MTTSNDYDLSEYSDKLWKNAYERGKAETLSVIEDIKAEIAENGNSDINAQIVLSIIDKHISKKD